MKSKPQRTCMGCNEKKEKQQLIRIVKNKQNEIKIDKTGKLLRNKLGGNYDCNNYRARAYICNNVACFDKVKKTKRLEKVLDMEISEKIYEDLRGVILE